MAKVTFTTPFQPSMPEAELEEPLRIAQNARRIGGFIKLGTPDEAWRKSVPFDFAFSELDLSGPGGPLAKIQRAILLRAIATGLIPAGTVQASD